MTSGTVSWWNYDPLFASQKLDDPKGKLSSSLLELRELIADCMCGRKTKWKMKNCTLSLFLCKIHLQFVAFYNAILVQCEKGINRVWYEALKVLYVSFIIAT